MTKIFKGYCFQCDKQSLDKNEFHTRGLCKSCNNEYFKLYMKKYNKTNYWYKSKWQLIIESQLPINM